MLDVVTAIAETDPVSSLLHMYPFLSMCNLEAQRKVVLKKQIKDV